MFKATLIAICSLLCCWQVAAQTKSSQRPEDIKKVQPLQKAIQPNSKNSSMAHPTKADGSMDMRYKVNKDRLKAIAPGPKKADGTPDLRFKENKQALKAPLKKMKRS
jgi:hypothetical protein